MRDRSLDFAPPTDYCAIDELDKRPGGSAALIADDPAEHLDVARHTIVLRSGRKIVYDKCLIATGGKPRELPELCDPSVDNAVQKRVHLFHTRRDFARLDERARLPHDEKRTIAVIGGGFLGTELACALAYRARTPAAPGLRYAAQASSAARRGSASAEPHLER